MKILFLLLLLQSACAKKDSSGPNINPGQGENPVKSDITAWITSPDNYILFQKQSASLNFATLSNSNPVIEVDSTKTYQEIDGFGNCLTGGSAMLIHHMDQASRSALLKELFASDSNNIGISYLRISIGASDLTDHVFSYDDMPAGQVDPALANFSVQEDKIDLIPVLKEILAINPSVKILCSPWSPPAWMKSNESSKGGSLKREYYDAYASYIVKYINAMKTEGVTIDAITVQNEPLNPDNTPSLYMTAVEEADFIKGSLGPAFKDAGISTKIIVFDHNCDHPDYPMTIYNDPEAEKYVDGAAFHLYAGRIDALTTVHNSYPAKNLYFTEQWVGAPGNLSGDLDWHVKNLVIGATRNWARNVLEWNLASDPAYNPHTNGGCDQCLGAITVNGNVYAKNPAWYIIAHCAKFVRPGSVRIASNLPDNLPNVAFRTPAGKKVLIVLNESGAVSYFNLSFKGKYAPLTLDKGAVATYIW